MGAGEAEFSEAIQRIPSYLDACAALVQLLCHCPDLKFRDPGRASAIARQALEHETSDQVAAGAWQLLGEAQYREGAWSESIQSLEKAMALRGTHRFVFPRQWFFIAMANWRLGKKDGAGRLYDQAVTWMERNDPDEPEMRSLGAEAASVLGRAVPDFFKRRPGPLLLCPAPEETVKNGAFDFNLSFTWEFKWAEVP